MAKTLSTSCPTRDCRSNRITDPVDGDYVTCDGCGLYHYTGDRV